MYSILVETLQVILTDQNLFALTDAQVCLALILLLRLLLPVLLLPFVSVSPLTSFESAAPPICWTTYM